MIKQLLVFIAAGLPLLAQVPAGGNAFQQNEWLRVPDIRRTATGNPLDGQSGPVLGKPISANEVRHSEQVLADGSHTSKSETERFYRDSMGRMRTETTTGAIIFDPAAGFIYNITTGSRRYTKAPVSSDAVVTIAAATNATSFSSRSGQSKQNAGPAPVIEDLPDQFLNGVYVKGARITTTIPAGAIGNDHDLKVVNERWYSDDLKLLVKSTNSDPRFGAATYELTDVLQSIPDPALFQIPAGYAERPLRGR
jgi:hypothetical protein